MMVINIKASSLFRPAVYSASLFMYFFCSAVFSDPKPIVFQSVTSISNSAKPFVSGARLVQNPGIYKELIYSIEPKCMAVIVGDFEIITAAHCLIGKTSLVILNMEVELNKTDMANCKFHETADVVLCVFPKKIGGEAAELKKEELDTDSRVKIVGVGCDAFDNDYGFREGTSTVLSTPSAPSHTYLLGKSGSISQLNSTLCFGDSGGPSFAVTKAGTRALVGINSSCYRSKGSVNCASVAVSKVVGISSIHEWVANLL